jgi:hypothetical protein
VASWLDLMALSATEPDTPWRSLAVSRPERPGAPPVVTDLVLAAPGTAAPTHRAAEALAVAVDCFRRGMAAPIPLFPAFSYQVYRGKDSARSWRGFGVPGDGDHPAVRLAFGNADYETIMQLPAGASDPPGVKGRVWRFAVHLYRTIDRSTTPAATTTDRARTVAWERSSGSGGGR